MKIGISVHFWQNVVLMGPDIIATTERTIWKKVLSLKSISTIA